MTAFKYGAFALIATIVNLASQTIVFGLYSGQASLFLGILIGTVSGLICKYLLDKKYVFYHQSESHSDELRNFSVYSLFGIVTTAIFWAAEILFDWLFEHHLARYVGAVIGLTVGYICKYYLDKHFVFTSTKTQAAISRGSK